MSWPAGLRPWTSTRQFLFRRFPALHLAVPAENLQVPLIGGYHETIRRLVSCRRKQLRHLLRAMSICHPHHDRPPHIAATPQADPLRTMGHPLIRHRRPRQPEPGVPLRWPRWPIPAPMRAGLAGGILPGRSSVDGGIPEFREITRSNRASRLRNSAFSRSSSHHGDPAHPARQEHQKQTTQQTTTHRATTCAPIPVRSSAAHPSASLATPRKRRDCLPRRVPVVRGPRAEGLVLSFVTTCSSHRSIVDKYCCP